MKLFVGLCAVAAVALTGAHVERAHALFIKKALKSVKKTAAKATKAVTNTAKGAGNAVKGAVTGAGKTIVNAATKVGTGAKRLFEAAKAGVVNLAKKAKVRAAELWAQVQKAGMYLFYQMLPGEFRRLQTKLLRKNSAGAAQAGRTTGSAFGAAPSAAAKGNEATFTFASSNPPVPASIAKYADWYDYKAGDVQPPAKVSRKGKQSLVKDQAARGTCVAFAVTAAMEAQLSRPKLISQEYVYWLLKDKDKSKICNEAEDGVNMEYAAQTLKGAGVPEEVHYLYLPWRGFDFAKMCPAGPTGLAKKLADYKAKNIYFFPWRSSGQGATIANPRFIEAAIDAGFDIVSAFDIAFMKDKMGAFSWFYDATIDPDTGKATQAPGGHAMLIVGYERSGKEEHGGGHIIVKNSWGALWGDGGYVRLSYDYVRQYAGDAFILEGFGK